MFLLITTKSKKNYVKFLGVYINDKLTRKNQIDHFCSKLSKVCGMVFKLRHFVPLTTLKVVYYSLFQSNIQYSLINWGRAAKSYLFKSYFVLSISFPDKFILFKTKSFKIRRHDKYGNRKIHV